MMTKFFHAMCHVDIPYINCKFFKSAIILSKTIYNTLKHSYYTEKSTHIPRATDMECVCVCARARARVLACYNMIWEFWVTRNCILPKLWAHSRFYCFADFFLCKNWCIFYFSSWRHQLWHRAHREIFQKKRHCFREFPEFPSKLFYTCYGCFRLNRNVPILWTFIVYGVSEA